MNRMKLVVLSLGALICARPHGLCTANTETPDDTRSDKKPTLASHSEELAELRKQLDAQAAELEQLRRASPVALTVAADDEPRLDSTSLLIKGAGVNAEDVNWRIRAGLTPAQAVEVAVN